jgi:hypothetical protein
VLSSAISALSDRLDAKFLAAYWLPAFVAVCGSFGILAVFVGPHQMDAWVNDLDSVEQGIGTVIVLLSITMLAFALRALTKPIVATFAGSDLPRAVAEWSTKGQRRARNTAAQVLGADASYPETVSSGRPAQQRLAQLFPQDDADLQPTLLGNVLATATEHPRLAYAMEGALWWPRLSPLLPSSFQAMLGGAQAPMMALLNLSVVFAALAVLGVAVLGLADGQWPVAVAFLIGGLVLSRLCYRAAVSQAVEVGSMLRVAFDLYRYEILRQMALDDPADLTAERVLWQQLTSQLLGLGEPTLTASDAPEAPASPSADGAP